MLHVVFRFRHNCLFAELSARHPGTTFAQWCNFRIDVIEVRSPGPEHAAALRRNLDELARAGFREVRSVEEESNTESHIVLTCAHRRGGAIEDVIERHGGLVFHPVIYRGGWEQYRFVALEDARVPALFAELRGLGEVEIVRKRKTKSSLVNSMFLSSEDLLGDLTPRQSKALAAAVEAGYYTVPRKARFQDIADRQGVPRTTYEEHVRKAEAKVIRAVAPYLSLVRGPEPEKRRLVKA